MTSASDRLHAALCEAFDVFLTLLPDATVRTGAVYASLGFETVSTYVVHTRPSDEAGPADH